MSQNAISIEFAHILGAFAPRMHLESLMSSDLSSLEERILLYTSTDGSRIAPKDLRRIIEMVTDCSTPEVIYASVRAGKTEQIVRDIVSRVSREWDEIAVNSVLGLPWPARRGISADLTLPKRLQGPTTKQRLSSSVSLRG
jgi:hypothetical protein